VLDALVRFVQALFFGCHRVVSSLRSFEGEYSRQVRETTSISEKGSVGFSLQVLTFEGTKIHRAGGLGFVFGFSGAALLPFLQGCGS
jgi:hypothetical protein